MIFVTALRECRLSPGTARPAIHKIQRTLVDAHEAAAEAGAKRLLGLGVLLRDAVLVPAPGTAA